MLPLKPGRLQHCLFWFWSGQFLRSIWTLSTPRSIYPSLHHLLCLSVYLSVSHFPFFCPSLACILFLWLQTPSRFMFSPPFSPHQKGFSAEKLLKTIHLKTKRVSLPAGRGQTLCFREKCQWLRRDLGPDPMLVLQGGTSPYLFYFFPFSRLFAVLKVEWERLSHTL